MKNKSFLALPLLLATLASCSGRNSEEKAISSTQSEVFSNLQKGFTVVGTFKTITTYYSDSNYNVPSTKSQKKSEYTFKLTYTNSEDYVGVDRRFYKVTDNAKRYLGGENAYENNGYVGLNYLDYNNNIQKDGYSSNDGYNEDAYASSGLVNPFTLMKASDFTTDSSVIYLSVEKTNLLYTNVFSGLSKYVSMKIPFTRLAFKTDFSSGAMTSLAYKTTEYEDYTNYYAKISYGVDFLFSEIGSANAKDKLVKEPSKSENDPLGKALKNMAGQKITITRHSITYEGVDKIDAEETVTTYNDGESIYMQVYDSANSEEAPSEASASDLYLKSKTDGGVLYAYVLGSKSGDKYTFVDGSTNYSSINGYYYYSSFQPNFSISQNIFNKNEDGSYSPTEDNLPYIGAECFVPALNITEEISSGYITSMKIYLSNDNNYIDHIQFLFEEDIYTGYTGQIIVTYSDIGTSKIPFAISVPTGLLG